ncbi:MAG TPA: hypothetical protein GXX40_08495 [Firmicutes bacterium]|nr:hypothetical protein [Bacillota bacterium]
MVGEGQPYCTSLNHAYLNRYIVFHCALDGQKLDNIRQNPTACCSVCTEHEVQPELHTTEYKSAVAFGAAEIAWRRGAKKAAPCQLFGEAGTGNGFPLQ